ncbi:unnamed protein product [Allacma fusca]|uniref:Uncharacterized protein n=1 Tax=Allacma fusca TaxID=39272 RepID=A0A8J2K183_9HEXA|nr:unnamed protein product [Allacma fusca]
MFDNIRNARLSTDYFGLSKLILLKELCYRELYQRWTAQQQNVKAQEQTIRNMQCMIMEGQYFMVRKRRGEACAEVDRFNRCQPKLGGCSVDLPWGATDIRSCTDWAIGKEVGFKYIVLISGL